MTEASNAAGDPPFAVSTQRPDTIRKTAPEDPPFIVSEERPQIILNRRGLIVNVGTRSKSPLTDAVLATLRKGGSVIVDFDDESHLRLSNRFTSLQQRLRVQRVVFRHSFVFDDDKADATKVQWWCEQLTPEENREEEAAQLPPPLAVPREPVVGRDVE